MKRQDRMSVSCVLGIALLVSIVSLASAPGIRGADAAWTLDSALKQLDKSTGGFRTAVADVELTSAEGESGEPVTAKGKAYFSSDGSFRMDLTDPDEKSLLVHGGSLYVYEPARALVERYPLAKHPERLEPYAAVGFAVAPHAGAAGAAPDVRQPEAAPPQSAAKQ